MLANLAALNFIHHKLGSKAKAPKQDFIGIISLIRFNGSDDIIELKEVLGIHKLTSKEGAHH